jgi:drug/metabolite transporter (DMT)-like permease
MTLPRERLKGVAFMLAAAVSFSTGGLLVRLADSTPPAALLVWRSVIVFLFLAALLALRDGRAFAGRVREGGVPGIVSALFLGATFCCFVFAVTRTTVANTAALMSTAPLMLTAAAWLFLREKAQATTWVAIVVALGGVLLMFADGLGSGGALSGNLFALGVPACFAASYILLRRSPARLDPMATSMLASAFAALAMLPFAWPLAFPAADLPALLAMGILQTGLGLALMSLAINRLAAAELGMVGLLEMVLAPVWVWLVLGEQPGAAALTGGIVIVGAVFVNQLYLLRASSRTV